MAVPVRVHVGRTEKELKKIQESTTHNRGMVALLATLREAYEIQTKQARVIHATLTSHPAPPSPLWLEERGDEVWDAAEAMGSAVGGEEREEEGGSRLPLFGGMREAHVDRFVEAVSAEKEAQELEREVERVAGAMGVGGEEWERVVRAGDGAVLGALREMEVRFGAMVEEKVEQRVALSGKAEEIRVLEEEYKAMKEEIQATVKANGKMRRRIQKLHRKARIHLEDVVAELPTRLASDLASLRSLRAATLRTLSPERSENSVVMLLDRETYNPESERLLGESPPLAEMASLLGFDPRVYSWNSLVPQLRKLEAQRAENQATIERLEEMAVERTEGAPFVGIASQRAMDRLAAKLAQVQAELKEHPGRDLDRAQDAVDAALESLDSVRAVLADWVDFPAQDAANGVADPRRVGGRTLSEWKTYWEQLT